MSTVYEEQKDEDEEETKSEQEETEQERTLSSDDIFTYHYRNNEKDLNVVIIREEQLKLQ